ncbi:PREDICTED: uncharacterized protein LOC109213536 [Nicotiana attenuata]|uniref:uncharacterized protein LOC109213536 n=1 Tax=Nicotiana attenuata TaxID=49451 RepID=UPI00090470CA|nr:PREDICTED: uncharacterized protein LOC109213536 [Nicotiana attenuata]
MEATGSTIEDLDPFNWTTATTVKRLTSAIIPQNQICQVLADFVADFSAKIIPEAEQETSRASPSLTDLWVLYTYGASNTSGSIPGLVLEVPTGEVICHSIRCSYMTNNEAEYEAVIVGLKLALRYGARWVVLRCGSQLVVNQVTGTFQIKEQRLQKYQAKIHKLVPEFDECQLEHKTLRQMVSPN